MLSDHEKELIRAGWKAGALYLMLLREQSPRTSPHTDHILARIRNLPANSAVDHAAIYAARRIEKMCPDECIPEDIAEAADLLHKEIDK